MNTTSRIAGLLISGFAVKTYAVGIASYVAYTVGTYVVGVLTTVQTTMAGTLG